MTKATAIKSALAASAVCLLVGCSEVITENMEVSSDEQAALDQEALEKNGNCRSGHWETVATYIDSARDIAAYDNVYAISKDGMTIYECTDGKNFQAMNNSTIFHKDHAVNIAVGERKYIEVNHARAVYHSGVWVTTESGAVYSLIVIHPTVGSISRIWNEAQPAGSAGDIGVNSDGTVYTFKDQGATDLVYRYDEDFNNNFTEALSPYRRINSDMIALDAGYFRTANYKSYSGLYVLCSDSTVRTIHASRYSSGPYSTPVSTNGIIPSKDIAAHPAEESFVTFDKSGNGKSAYYIHNSKIEYLGLARKISISKDGYLWDAYDGAIYKKKLY